MSGFARLNSNKVKAMKPTELITNSKQPSQRPGRDILGAGSQKLCWEVIAATVQNSTAETLHEWPEVVFRRGHGAEPNGWRCIVKGIAKELFLQYLQHMNPI